MTLKEISSFEIKFGDAALLAGENQLYLIVIILSCFFLMINHLASDNIAVVLIPEMLEDLLGGDCS